MTHRRAGAAGVLVLLLAGGLGLSGCGKSKSSSAAKPAITIGSFNFGESEFLADVYATALRRKGYTVNVRAKLGSREIVEPALESGQVDMVPEYEGTLLEFLNKSAGEASGDTVATAAKLRDRLKAKNVVALTPSPAADQNAFAVTKTTADKDHLTKVSDLAPVASKLVLGGPPECPTRPFCQPGLQKTYGLTFKSFKSLDAGGALTKDALAKGDIDVGLIFSSDGSIEARGFTVLDDDKHLQTADNVIPVLRSAKATSEIRSVLDATSAKITTALLQQYNKKIDVDKADPSDAAKQFSDAYLM
ncbi:MAG: ABC transporter substrate-binding protein [Actinobacteria bacterium]|nr:MAG: ABC transporter substrate-binding protein [Actinomycetota bacterium]